MNAYVTVIPAAGPYGEYVTATVDPLTVTVPDRCPDHGLTDLWHRVGEAIRGLGHELDGVSEDCGWEWDGGNVIRFNAKPVDR